jgi:hypothetical protein
MAYVNIILAKCLHANSSGMSKGCEACRGSGYVKVVPGPDGETVKCLHANNNGIADGCKACRGSGWAGLIWFSEIDDKV